MLYHKDYNIAILVLLRALFIISTKWTNKGYKILQEDGTFKVCIYGALDTATRQLYRRPVTESDLSVKLLTQSSMLMFGRSIVSTNDDLGYASIIKLFALTLERAFPHATSDNPDDRRLERNRA